MRNEYLAFFERHPNHTDKIPNTNFLEKTFPERGQHFKRQLSQPLEYKY